MSSGRSPAIPRDLGEAGQFLWRRIVKDFELAPWEVILVAEACRTVDMLKRLHDEAGDAELDPKLLREIRLQQESVRKLLSGIAWPSETSWDGLSASERGRRAAHIRHSGGGSGSRAAEAARARWRSGDG